jgi:acyl-[acyl-carrier-protein] desaturase
LSAALREGLYRHFMTWSEHSERTRSWSVFHDIPWSDAASAPRDAEIALSAETFFGVEMFLPDYLAQGASLWRDDLGQALYAASWGAEEARHSIALREYLLRTDQRSLDEVHRFEHVLTQHRWTLPFAEPRRMVIYGALQELTTFVNYTRHARHAADRGHELLAGIYRLIARDEIAHCRFQERVIELMLAEDERGTLADLGHVFHHFAMPMESVLDDAAHRREVFLQAGITRTTFVRDVWLTMLKRLGIERQSIPRPAIAPQIAAP